jgi:hypothetical protein
VTVNILSVLGLAVRFVVKQVRGDRVQLWAWLFCPWECFLMPTGRDKRDDLPEPSIPKELRQTAGLQNESHLFLRRSHLFLLLRSNKS